MWDPPETNLSLIARVKNLADGAAWAEFLEIYRPVVYRLARRRAMQDADAQDVVQRVFLAISQAIEGWEPNPNLPPFRAWLMTLSRNVITKALARKRPDEGAGSSDVRDLLEMLPADDSQITAELVSEGRREIFRWASEQVRPEFSQTTWSLFWETAVQGRSVADVSLSAGRSAGAIYMARFRVLQRLKEKVHEVSHQWDV